MTQTTVTPRNCARLLEKTFPQLRAPTRPLAVGVREQIVADYKRRGTLVPTKFIRLGLRYVTLNFHYQAMIAAAEPGTPRINLDGSVASTVVQPDHIAHAADFVKLAEQRRAAKRGRRS